MSRATDKQNRPPPDGATDYLDLDDRALLALCEVDTYRASGPGGQKRNKTDSAVRLRLRDVGIMVVGTESRSQHENRARALRRLRQAIALELRRPINPDEYRPGDLMREVISSRRRLEVGPRDVRYPRVVRELLDVFAVSGAQLSRTSDLLGVSTAALSAFLTRDAKLLSTANKMRAAAGLKPIR